MRRARPSKGSCRPFSASMVCPKLSCVTMAAPGAEATRTGVEPAGGLVDPFRNSAPAWPPGPSANPGQRGTLSPHPQSRTAAGALFSDLADCQRHFDPWRDRYNLVRPHEALHLDPPGRHYQPSGRSFPEVLPPVEYDNGPSCVKCRRTAKSPTMTWSIRWAKAW